MYLTEEREVMEATRYFPSISLIIPLPSKSSGIDVHKEIQRLSREASSKLLKEYPDEQALPVIKKLQKQLQDLDYSLFKRSVAIYVSPLVQKTFYLDIPVEEKLVIDESFEIRDIIQNKVDNVEYILFVLSSHSFKWYHGSSGSVLTLLKEQNNPHLVSESEHGRVGYFSDPVVKKQTALDKFIHDADDTLSALIKSNHLPVLFIAPRKVMGMFKQLSKNIKNIPVFITGGYEEESATELKQRIVPYLERLKEMRQHYQLKVLQDAIDDNRVAIGIEDIWTAVAHKNCRLLLVESGYRCMAAHLDKPDAIQLVQTADVNRRLIQDAVNEVIERVVHHGGEVEFLDSEALKDYLHIALIKFY
jgi:hypothetical protein